MNNIIHNPVRGEMCFDLAGTPLILEPSFARLAALEAHCQLSLIEMASLMHNNQLHLKNMVAILSLSNISNLDENAIITLVEKTGVVAVYEIAAQFLAAVLSVGTDGHKDQKPQAPKSK